MRSGQTEPMGAGRGELAMRRGQTEPMGAGRGTSRSHAEPCAEGWAGEDAGADRFAALLAEELRVVAEAEPRPGLEGRVLARVRSAEGFGITIATGGRDLAIGSGLAMRSALARMLPIAAAVLLAMGSGAVALKRIARPRPVMQRSATAARGEVAAARTGMQVRETAAAGEAGAAGEMGAEVTSSVAVTRVAQESSMSRGAATTHRRLARKTRAAGVDDGLKPVELAAVAIEPLRIEALPAVSEPAPLEVQDAVTPRTR